MYCKELKHRFCLFKGNWNSTRIERPDCEKGKTAHFDFFKSILKNYVGRNPSERTTRYWWSQRNTHVTADDNSNCCRAGAAAASPVSPPAMFRSAGKILILVQPVVDGMIAWESPGGPSPCRSGDGGRCASADRNCCSYHGCCLMLLAPRRVGWGGATADGNYMPASAATPALQVPAPPHAAAARRIPPQPAALKGAHCSSRAACAGVVDGGVLGRTGAVLPELGGAGAGGGRCSSLLDQVHCKDSKDLHRRSPRPSPQVGWGWRWEINSVHVLTCAHAHAPSRTHVRTQKHPSCCPSGRPSVPLSGPPAGRRRTQPPPLPPLPPAPRRPAGPPQGRIRPVPLPGRAGAGAPSQLLSPLSSHRSEEHTSELQSR